MGSASQLDSPAHSAAASHSPVYRQGGDISPNSQDSSLTQAFFCATPLLAGATVGQSLFQHYRVGLAKEKLYLAVTRFVRQYPPSDIEKAVSFRWYSLSLVKLYNCLCPLFHGNFLLLRNGGEFFLGNLHGQHTIVLAGLDSVGIDIIGQN